MADAEHVTDGERLDEALKQIRGVTIDEGSIRAHVMRPANVLGVTSDRGLDAERPPTPTRHVEGQGPQEFLGFVGGARQLPYRLGGPVPLHDRLRRVPGQHRREATATPPGLRCPPGSWDTAGVASSAAQLGP
jgi:hypothetical protein